MSKTTKYHGQVGHVKDWGEYHDWLYDFGLVTYTWGLYSDEYNEPLEIVKGTPPFQVETYYTQPLGPAYP